ncbi:MULTISPECIES: type III PLP-dependent enzyme domain-containing protein [Streptomyces]|uniref:type III PLP-dependent enzyme n=1 Tax=Streptomyces TaxID=1883 RepID=UPI00163C8242|nr:MULTISPECIES: type III PLP-dependent enzyme [Streptomyces]MBC2874259.1 type III PLP-dependent enzyme [Streptomyces sp. TYQ1024]UBI40294.1 type III PLP-dependent enzyme [Streptomyces mobaraensis]UKW32874.1 type III PLP-dependent enzyme [Streptomyces sp. TYQ1024]
MDVEVGEAVTKPALSETRWETPAYLYDLAAVRDAHRRLVGSLPDSAGLLYSLKANAHPAVLGQLAALGCQAEVSSSGELRAAVQAGFAADGILYTGPGKSDGAVIRALKAGVRQFSVDSPHALDQLDRLGRAEGTRVCALLRVNPPVPPAGAGLAMTGGPSQFGVDLSWVLERPWLFESREYADLMGMHLYMGSNLTQVTTLLAMFRYGLDVVRQVETALGRRLHMVDLGGGFGAPYAVHGELPRFDALKSRLDALLKEELSGWQEGERRVVFESGRYLSASCGRLLTSVLDVKHSHGRRVVVLDSGVHHLGGMSGLGKEAQIEPQFQCDQEPHALTGGDGSEETIVAGPLCHPLDVWTRNARLPEVAIGDVVTVPNVGAYGLQAALALFHLHPMPLEVVLDGEREITRGRLFLGRGRSAR